MKIKLLGYGFFALLSGDDWHMANEMAEFVKGRIQSQGRSTRRDVLLQTVRNAANGFKASPFCDQSKNIDLIVGGFVEDEPILLQTGFQNGSGYADGSGDMAIVGSGWQIANTMLSLRQYQAEIVPWMSAAYMAYEAKKYSENSPGVGTQTWMDVFIPYPAAPRDGGIKTAWPAESDILDRFEVCRRAFGLQPINPAALPRPLHPTDAP